VVPPQRGAAARGPRHPRGRALRAGRRGSGRRPRATDRLRDHRGAHPVRHGDGVYRAGHRGRLRPPLRLAQATRRDAPAVLGDHRGEDRRDAGPGRRAEHPARSDRGRPGLAAGPRRTRRGRRVDRTREHLVLGDGAALGRDPQGRDRPRVGQPHLVPPHRRGGPGDRGGRPPGSRARPPRRRTLLRADLRTRHRRRRWVPRAGHARPAGLDRGDRRPRGAVLLLHLTAGVGGHAPRIGGVTTPPRSLLSRLPAPSIRVQKGLALANVIAQIGIMTTGVTVRVTASGLGCETWPRCNEDSLVPVPGAAPALHQAVEFGNRLLTFVLTAVAVALILAVLRAGRRHQITVLALAMPLGIVAQAVIGGISVLPGLLWWTVALQLMPSMVLAWVAAILCARIGEDDEAPARRVVPAPLSWLTALSAVLLAAVVVSGTMVTG